MGWFKPKPLELEYGQPVHVMVARAFLHGAFYSNGDSLRPLKYHFTGPHGIEYRGDLPWHGKSPDDVAKLCEDVQQDFNERIAAMSKARAYARDQLSVPPLFSPVATDD